MDPDFIVNKVGDAPKRNYDKIKAEGGIKSHAEFSNDVPRGAASRFIAGRDFDALRSLRGRGEEQRGVLESAPGGNQSQEAPGSQPTPTGSSAEAVAPTVPDPEDESALRRFWGDEAGTSLVGVIFKQTKAEGDAMRLKRSEALKAAKAAMDSPEERKAGEKLRMWFSSELDSWVARTNQVTEQISRKTVPKIATREAIAIAREFRNKPQELQQFIDGSHRDLQMIDGGVARAMMNLDHMQPLMREALRMLVNGMTAGEAAADEAYTTLAEASLVEGKNGGWLGSRWDSEVYVPHYLNAKGKGLVAEEPSTAGRVMGGQIGKFFGFAETRADQYPTLLHAIADGIVPKTMDASALFTIHGAQFARARATHVFETHLADSGLGIYTTAERAPKGWEPLAGHADEFRKLVPYMRKIGEGAEPRMNRSYNGVAEPGAETKEIPDVAEQRLYVPKYIEHAMAPITMPDWNPKYRWFAKTRSAQRGLKEAILGLSGFHALTENYMGFHDIGPAQMVRALRISREDSTLLLNERDGVAHGLTTSILGKTVEAYKRLTPGTIPTRGMVARAYAFGNKEVLGVADAVTKFTFENIQRRYKVWSFATHRDAFLRDNPNATAAEVAEAKRGIASYVNGVYGGLHWENMGFPRAVVETMRLVLLAPDWTGSNVALAKYAMDERPSMAEAGFQHWHSTALRGALSKESAQARLSRQFWLKQGAEALIATQLLSVALSGTYSKRPFQVYHGQDDEGREVYQNVFFRASGGDAINMLSKMEEHGVLGGFGVFVQSKAAPFTKLAMHTMTGRDDLGREITPKGMDWKAATVRGLGNALGDVSPVPLTLRQVYRQATDNTADYLWSERILSMLGPPAQHVAPEGMKWSAKHGYLEEKHEKPAQSVWDEILTGKR